MNAFQHVAAVLVAAGKSSRMGGGANKVLRPLGGRPVLAYSLQALDQSPLVQTIALVGRDEDFEAIVPIIEECCPAKDLCFVEGGAERFDSVKNGLETLADLEDSNPGMPDAVLVHDAARPFLRQAYIDDSLSVLNGYSGAVIGVPLKDTLKETTSHAAVAQTHNRARFWLAQTPQTFWFHDILEAYRACTPPPYPTDDGEVLEKHGQAVKMVLGSYLNIKLTAPEDWVLAEAILKASTIDTQ